MDRLERLAIESRKVLSLLHRDDLRHIYLVSLEFLDLGSHTLEQRGNFGSSRFADMDRKGLSSVVTESKIIVHVLTISEKKRALFTTTQPSRSLQGFEAYLRRNHAKRRCDMPVIGVVPTRRSVAKIFHGGDPDDIVCQSRQLLVVLIGNRYNRPPPCFDLLQIAHDFVVNGAAGNDEDRRSVSVHQRNWTMLHFGCRVPLRMDIADFL